MGLQPTHRSAGHDAIQAPSPGRRPSHDHRRPRAIQIGVEGYLFTHAHKRAATNRMPVGATDLLQNRTNSSPAPSSVRASVMSCHTIINHRQIILACRPCRTHIIESPFQELLLRHTPNVGARVPVAHGAMWAIPSSPSKIG